MENSAPFNSINHKNLVLFLSLSVSFIVAFVTMVFTWWVLGAIVNPERILTFASAVLVFVGSVKQMMGDIKNMKEEGEKKIKEAVSALLEDVRKNIHDGR